MNKLSREFFRLFEEFPIFRGYPRIIKLIGLFGWNVPGADPKSYDEYGAPKRKYSIEREER